MGKDFLQLLPLTSDDDIQQKLKTFCDGRPQLEKMYAVVLTYIEEEKTTELLDKLRTYIHKTE